MTERWSRTTVVAARSPLRRTVSRRGVLIAGLAGLAGAAELGWAARPSGAEGRVAGARSAPVAALAPAEPVARAAEPVAGTAERPAPHPRHRWTAPIYGLDDVLRHDRRISLPHRAIMLTIDDGPDPEWTPKYLRLLAHYDVPATFCMIGRQVAAHRKIVRAVAAHGHAIANHTWTHDEALETRPLADIRAEIGRTSAAIHAATGHAPTLFRAPGGVWGPRLLAELDRQRLAPLGWDVDPRDWSLPGTAAIESTMLTARRHDIILCHDGGGDRSQTYAALKRVVPTLLDRGYRFVTLPVLR